LKKKYVSRRKWQSLLGELRSTVPAIHSSKYMFSVLQSLLTQACSRRLRLTALAKSTLKTWITLLQSIHIRPVPITQLVPHAPHYYAATDASAAGMGGYWMPTNLTTDSQPIAWRYPWDLSVRHRLLTHTNPNGDIPINVLELSALVTGHHVQTKYINTTQYVNTVLATDNTPTQAWVNKGSVSTTKSPAFLLSLLAADCRRWNSHLSPLYTAGATNHIADFLSRSFTLTDAELLVRLNDMAPVQPPWKLATLPASWVSKMNCALSRQPQLLEFQPALQELQTHTGPSGVPSAKTSVVTPSYSPSMTQCPSSKFSLAATEWEPYLPPILRSNLAQWRVPYVPWGRRSPHWASAIPDFSRPVSWISAYSDNYKHTLKKIPPPPESNPYPYKSYNTSFTAVTRPQTPARIPLLT
jgi:hypothetical protein